MPEKSKNHGGRGDAVASTYPLCSHDMYVKVCRLLRSAIIAVQKNKNLKGFNLCMSWTGFV